MKNKIQGIQWAATLAVGMALSAVAQLQDSTNAMPTQAVASTNATATNTTTTVEAAAKNATNIPTRANKDRAIRKRGPIVVFGGTAELKAGESADAVVAIGGSAKARGNVQGAVVGICGNSDAEGEVHDAVVAILGNASAKGKVHDAVVAIGGDAVVSGEVGDAVVSILGDVKILPGSTVRGDVVSVGGKVDVPDNAKVKGEVVQVGGNIPGIGLFHGIGDWVRDCLFKFRLLAPHAKFGWVVAGLHFFLLLLVTLLLARPVTACADELVKRPATTFLLGLLTKLLIPLVILVLAITGAGLLIIPFVSVAAFIAVLIGKAAVFIALGRQTYRMLGGQVPVPVLALLIGAVLVTLIYMVPVISLLVYFIIGIWAIGAAVTACFGGMRKEMLPHPCAPPVAAAVPGIQPATVPPNINANSPPQSTGATPSAESVQPSVMTAADLLPKAGFWERMGAAFLDIVLVSLLSALVGRLPFGLLVALAYFAGMWTWKGTTVGGIVLNLKVVRGDRRPLNFATALVRALAASFSAVVCFLGFIWIAWDLDKQGWHDKIAGTIVVREPRATPLV